ncbi:MAG: hypothetical protein RIM84_09840 [Alphaproteobacteria bacterium]
MQQRLRRRSGFGQLTFQLGLPGLQPFQLRQQGLRSAFGQQVDKRPYTAIDVTELCLGLLANCVAVMRHPVDLVDVGPSKLLDQRRMHQASAQAVQDGCLKHIAADVQAIVAGPAVAGVAAAHQVRRDHRIAAATGAALHQL